MEFHRLLDKRQSVREFTSKSVNWRRAMDAIEAASKGPFAGNINNLKFIIVEDPDAINSLAHSCGQLWINDSSLVIVVCSDESPLEREYDERGRVYSRQQAGAAILTLQLELENLGIQSCWVGACDEGKIRETLEIEKHDITIEAIIPTGYAKHKKNKPRKKSLSSLIFWDKWGQDSRKSVF